MISALPMRQVEKPWGVDVLPAPFEAPAGARIGEIWFEPPQALSDLLVKYIFTSEALSVQVHPNDAQTSAKGIGCQGKEECWLIIAAEPGAKLGIGFNEPLSPETMRAAALDGSIEHLMTWHDVAAGDFFYIPANTVHAIGAGVSLIEVQQNSDITYRLYDYGRPRELHLEESVVVAKGERYALDLWHTKVADHAVQTLVDGPLFLLDQVVASPSAQMAARYPDALLVIPRAGSVEIAGEVIAAGACGLASSLSDVRFAENAVTLLTRACAATK